MPVDHINLEATQPLVRVIADHPVTTQVGYSQKVEPAPAGPGLRWSSRTSRQPFTGGWMVE